jgi:hypothetical protein
MKETEIRRMDKITSRTDQVIKTFGRLGRELRISPKANVTVNKAGHKKEFFVETIDVIIGIGNDFTASLVMDIDAWEAFKKGEKIHITTTKEFKEKFL